MGEDHKVLAIGDLERDVISRPGPATYHRLLRQQGDLVQNHGFEYSRNEAKTAEEIAKRVDVP